MKLGERNPEEAMARGVYEELGVSGEIDLVKTNLEEQVRDSESYPGLRSKFLFHIFEVMLNDDQFNSEGYVEEQSDLTTYFIWEKLN